MPTSESRQELNDKRHSRFVTDRAFLHKLMIPRTIGQISAENRVSSVDYRGAQITATTAAGVVDRLGQDRAGEIFVRYDPASHL